MDRMSSIELALKNETTEMKFTDLFKVRYDAAVPVDEIWFEDRNGNVVARIVNIRATTEIVEKNGDDEWERITLKDV